MVALLFAVGILVAAFVGFNIGGSSTGVAFGPAVGSRMVSKTHAAALMTVFALAGGATVGTKVIDTMGGRIVPSDQFTLAASVTVLFFVGLALLVSNLFGVPASTSMTAVGAIAGLGVASNRIDWGVMGQIVSWWLVAPIVAFWLCAVIGRYVYPHLEARFAIESEGEGRTRREVVGGVLVVVIGCYMAFSAGASNVANAVAPLVGSGELALYPGVALAGGAIGLGAFTIARRTLDTVGNDLTDLPILAALIVEVVSATIITLLSAGGIPASLAVSATMCVVGLGWGRATRTTTLSQAAQAAVSGERSTDAEIAVDALATADRPPAADRAPADRAIERAVSDAVKTEVDRAVTERVGPAVEEQMGEAVGEAVEEQVGEAVGEAVEEQVGEAVGEAIEEQVGGEVAAEVTESVEEQVGEEVAADVSEEVSDSVEEQLGAELSESVEAASASLEEEVSDEVAAQVTDTVGAEVGEAVRAEMAGAAGGPPADREAGADVASIGEAEPEQLTAADLFDPATTGRVVMLWILTPTISAVASYLVFQFAPWF